MSSNLADKFIGKYMRMAKQVGEDKNPCYSRKIGVVLVRVYPDGASKVLGTGYNGPPRHTPHCDSEEYLTDIVWPQLTEEDKTFALATVANPPESDKENDREAAFLWAYAGCNQCPRKVIGAKSGERTELCSCLSYESRVQMADGSWVKIGKLVHERIAGLVRTLDITTGKTVIRRITGWHKTPFLPGQSWYKIITKRGRRGRHGQLGGKFTHDHKILTRRGYVSVEHLQPGDLVATPEMCLSERQKQLVLGSLLGDASLLKTSGGVRFSVKHASKHHQYAMRKAELLTSIGVRCHTEVRTKVTPAGHEYKNHKMIGVTTTPLLQLLACREMTYPHKQKRISQEWLDQVGPEGLAYWYMDDGSLLAERAGYIAINKFVDDFEIIRRWFLDRYGICVRMTTGKRLYFDHHAMQQLCDLIAPFVVPVMKYKLLPSHQNVPYTIIDDKATGPYYDEVVSVLCLPQTVAEYHHDSYCIDVEDTHNFYTIGCVVHNCEHGEKNAIANATGDLRGAWAFCWCGVACWDCTKLMINAGIKHAYFVDDGSYARNGGSDYSFGSRWLFEKAGVEIFVRKPEVYLS